jgi:hypothetical protein
MDNQRLVTVWAFAIGLLIFLGGLWCWYQYVHRNTYNVFWDSIDNNLDIYGVTRTVDQEANGSSVQQKLQVSLGQDNIARSITTIKQPTQGGETTVITETIGTPGDNFTRYTDIKSPAPVDTSKVRNVWSREKLAAGAGQNQSVFAEGLFSSIPFANLTQPQRQELVTFMKDQKVYEVDYRGAKTVERAGKQGFEYTVQVNLQAYIETLKKIDTMMGLKQLESVDPAQYAGAEPAQLVIVNSIDGRQLLEVTYAGTSRKETYSSYGARIIINIPDAKIQRAELEQQIQSIFTPVTSGT